MKPFLKMIHSDEDFVLTIAAPRRSGKSYLIKTLMNNGLLDPYEHVIIMCPTLDYNNDYLEFEKNKKVTFLATVEHDDIDELFEKQSKCMKKVRHRERYEKDLPKIKCPRTLLLLDDCIDSGVLNFRGTVDKIAERGRHINLSLIISSQRISAVSRSIRLNSDYFIIFSPYSISEMEQYLEQFVSRDRRKEVRLKLLDVFEVPYKFVILDNTIKNPALKLKTSTAEKYVTNQTELLL